MAVFKHTKACTARMLVLVLTTSRTFCRLRLGFKVKVEVRACGKYVVTESPHKDRSVCI